MPQVSRSILWGWATSRTNPIIGRSARLAQLAAPRIHGDPRLRSGRGSYEQQEPQNSPRHFGPNAHCDPFSKAFNGWKRFGSRLDDVNVHTCRLFLLLKGCPDGNPPAISSSTQTRSRTRSLAAESAEGARKPSHLGDRICVAYGQMVTVDWRSGGGDTEAANDEGWDEEVQEWTSWSDCSCECGADMRASQRQF